jgi:hypothetical protein
MAVAVGSGMISYETTNRIVPLPEAGTSITCRHSNTPCLGLELAVRVARCADWSHSSDHARAFHLMLPSMVRSITEYLRLAT